MKNFQVLLNGKTSVLRSNRLETVQSTFNQTAKTMQVGEVVEYTHKGRTRRIVEKTKRGLFEIFGMAARVKYAG